MIKIHFENLQEITINQLLKAQKDVRIAVAWINFDDYKTVFLHLIKRNVKIRIIVNDDDNNRRYRDVLAQLRDYGIKIKCVKTNGIMHHKFCIIDNMVCMHGSFNWTRNANEKNCEDLSITDEVSVIRDYLLQFKALWELSKQDLRLLRKPNHCKYCGDTEINICLLEQVEPCDTKMCIIRRCSCKEKKIAEEYYDISVYNQLKSIYDWYNDELLRSLQMEDELEYQDVQEEMDYAISNYLAYVRRNRLGCDIIHAVGVKDWRYFYRNEGEWYYKIIWKEKYTSSYIRDAYDIVE